MNGRHTHNETKQVDSLTFQVLTICDTWTAPKGGLACSATCTASSSATSDLGCGVLVDGAVLSVPWLFSFLSQARPSLGLEVSLASA